MLLTTIFVMYFLISNGLQFLTGPNWFFQHYIMTLTVRDWCTAPVHGTCWIFIPVTQESLSFIIQCMFEPSGYFSVISIRLPERFIQNDEAPQMLFIHPVLSSSPPETLISVLRLIKWCWSIWEANLCDTCYWRVSDKSCGASERQLDWWLSSGNAGLFALCHKTSFNWHGTLLYKIKNGKLTVQRKVHMTEK